jgi:transposase
MNDMNYAGLDIYKKSISCCLRQADGTILQESTITATRQALDEWVRRLPQPWMAGMEATMFTGWIYDHLVSCGVVVKVAHPAMLQAIAAGKKKNDRVDARKIADLLRCDYFPECHMASREIRDRRRVLRYRNLLVRQAVQMKNKVSGLLMEAGVPYNQQDALVAGGETVGVHQILPDRHGVATTRRFAANTGVLTQLGLEYGADGAG